MTGNNHISYRDLYNLVDERFTRFEEKLDNRFAQMDERITRVNESLFSHIQKTDEKFADLTLFKHRVLWYFSVVFTGIAFVVNIFSTWIKKQLGVL